MRRKFEYEHVCLDDMGLAGHLHEFGIVTDRETGVMYVVMRGGVGDGSWGGITPRLDRDGKPMVREVDE